MIMKEETNVQRKLFEKTTIYSCVLMCSNPKVMRATPRLVALCERFDDDLVRRAEKVRASRPQYEPPPRKSRMRLAKHKCKFQSRMRLAKHFIPIFVLLFVYIRSVLKRRRECGTYLATARRHRRRLKMQKRDE